MIQLSLQSSLLASFALSLASSQANPVLEHHPSSLALKSNAMDTLHPPEMPHATQHALLMARNAEARSAEASKRVSKGGALSAGAESSSARPQESRIASHKGDAKNKSPQGKSSRRIQNSNLNAVNPSTLTQLGSGVASPSAKTIDGADEVSSEADWVNPIQLNKQALQTSSANAFHVGLPQLFQAAPLPTQQTAYLKASNTEFMDLFGFAIAIDGDTMAIGAVLEDSAAAGVNGDQLDNSSVDGGAVYIYVRAGSTWVQQAYLKASNPGGGHFFGFSVALCGDTLVVGASNESSGSVGVDGDQLNNNALDSGAAYVFVRTGSTWTQQAYLKASNTDAGDQFGLSVSIFGETIVVGAPAEAGQSTGVDGDQTSNASNFTGAAYVFVRNGAIWTQQAYLKASNSNAFDEFGYSVSISGETITVGAPFEDSISTGIDGDQGDNSAQATGAVYIFLRNNDVWSQQAYMKASTVGDLDNFGRSISICGDTLVIGANGEDSDSTGVDGDQSNSAAFDAGAAFVFNRSGATWSQQAYLKASNTRADAFFGWTVSISGNIISVGSHGESSLGVGVEGDQGDGGAPRTGAAYVFARNGGTWRPKQYLKPSNTDDRDEFGFEVAVSGNTVVVGSVWEDSDSLGVDGDQASNGAMDAGAAYVFELGTNALASSRNAGSNPQSYTASTPVLGGSWTGLVDLSGTTGHANALIVAYIAPQSFVLGGGQVVLVDLSGPRLFTLPSQAGPVASWTLTLPSDPSFAGLTISTQAVHIGGVQPFALSNAVDLLLDF